MSNQAKLLVARFLAAKSQGPDIRSKLNGARIGLNNIPHKYGPGNKEPYFDGAIKDFTSLLNDITSVLFSVHDDVAKSHLTKAVISEINQGIDAAKAHDAHGVAVSAERASSFLGGAIEYLNDNPDNAEKKERLSSLMSFVFPHSDQNGSSDHNFEQAIKLCKEIAETEKPKGKAWFTDLADALEKVNDAKKDLRSAAAFAYKMLPKAR